MTGMWLDTGMTDRGTRFVLLCIPTLLFVLFVLFVPFVDYALIY